MASQLVRKTLFSAHFQRTSHEIDLSFLHTRTHFTKLITRRTAKLETHIHFLSYATRSLTLSGMPASSKAWNAPRMRVWVMFKLLAKSSWRGGGVRQKFWFHYFKFSQRIAHTKSTNTTATQLKNGKNMHKNKICWTRTVSSCKMCYRTRI